MSNKSDRAKEFKDNVFNTFIGNIDDNSSVEQKEVKTPVKTPTKEVSEVAIKSMVNAMDKVVNGYKYKNGVDKKDNYTITFKIDADIEDYLKNIGYISFIENKTKGLDATEYVNTLIREDMLKTLNIDASEKDPNKWIDAYNKYKSKKGL
jgi:hypothetical protein